jgi:hypothetical protein
LGCGARIKGDAYEPGPRFRRGVENGFVVCRKAGKLLIGPVVVDTPSRIGLHSFAMACSALARAGFGEIREPAGHGLRGESLLEAKASRTNASWPGPPTDHLLTDTVESGHRGFQPLCASTAPSHACTQPERDLAPTDLVARDAVVAARGVPIRS